MKVQRSQVGVQKVNLSALPPQVTGEVIPLSQNLRVIVWGVEYGAQ